MPPLSLTHAKYAVAVLPIVVKSTPGISMSRPASLIGAPVAFLPFPRPQTPRAPASPSPGGVPAPAAAQRRRLPLSGGRAVRACARSRDRDGGRQQRSDPAHGECPPKRHPHPPVLWLSVEPLEWGLPICVRVCGTSPRIPDDEGV